MAPHPGIRWRNIWKNKEIKMTAHPGFNEECEEYKAKRIQREKIIKLEEKFNQLTNQHKFLIKQNAEIKELNEKLKKLAEQTYYLAKHVEKTNKDLTQMRKIIFN